MATFGKQAQELITDPEVYRLFDVLSAKVDSIVELLAKKRRSALAALKDYTDGLMEVQEMMLKPPEKVESSSEEDFDEEDLEEEEVMLGEQLDCNFFTTHD